MNYYHVFLLCFVQFDIDILYTLYRNCACHFQGILFFFCLVLHLVEKGLSCLISDLISHIAERCQPSTDMKR